MARRIPLISILLTLLAAGSPRAAEVRGPQVSERTARVMNSIHWAGDLKQVLAQAQTEKKLVFWLQLVGELDGGL